LDFGTILSFNKQTLKFGNNGIESTEIEFVKYDFFVVDFLPFKKTAAIQKPWRGVLPLAAPRTFLGKSALFNPIFGFIFPSISIKSG